MIDEPSRGGSQLDRGTLPRSPELWSRDVVQDAANVDVQCATRTTRVLYTRLSYSSTVGRRIFFTRRYEQLRIKNCISNGTGWNHIENIRTYFFYASEKLRRVDKLVKEKNKFCRGFERDPELYCWISSRMSHWGRSYVRWAIVLRLEKSHEDRALRFFFI